MRFTSRLLSVDNFAAKLWDREAGELFAVESFLFAQDTQRYGFTELDALRIVRAPMDPRDVACYRDIGRKLVDFATHGDLAAVRTSARN